MIDLVILGIGAIENTYIAPIVIKSSCELKLRVSMIRRPDSETRFPEDVLGIENQVTLYI
jgi:hypothetical protein